MYEGAILGATPHDSKLLFGVRVTRGKVSHEGAETRRGRNRARFAVVAAVYDRRRGGAALPSSHREFENEKARPNFQIHQIDQIRKGKGYADTMRSR